MVPPSLADERYGAPVYTEDQQDRLTANLDGLMTRVHQGAYSARLLGPDLLRELHRELFEDVRDHGGRMRAPGFGSFG